MEKWIRSGYTVEKVEFDYDLKEFEVRQGDKVQTISPATIEDMEDIIDALNDGEDVNGWEDGIGNTIYVKEVNELTLEEIIDFLNENYLVNGENEKYKEVFDSLEDLKAEGLEGKVENSLNIGQDIEGLQYPIIYFDDSNSDSGQIYQSDELEMAIEKAKDYFKAK